MSQNILNIVFISLYYKPIWPGFGTRYAELLTDEAAKNGHNVTMLTGKIPKNLKVDDIYRQKISIESMGKGKVKTIRLWSTDLDHEGFLNRIIAYTTFIFQCFFKILFSRNVDVLMALHPFPPFFVSILLLCKLKKIKFIVNITDLWPDNFIELGVIKNKFIYSIVKKLCTFVYENSDTAIISNDELKTGVSKYFSNQDKMFIFGLDSFHFQNKLIKTESTDMNKFYNLLCNKMYSDYYKLLKIINLFINENVIK